MTSSRLPDDPGTLSEEPRQAPQSHPWRVAILAGAIMGLTALGLLLIACGG